MRPKSVLVLPAILACAGLAAPAQGASHLWIVSEVFSNADGTIQFVELTNPTSATAETVLNGKWVNSVGTGSQYTFTANLVGNTAFKSLLLGTAAYAALPGAPAPDYIIPPGFVATAGDTIRYWLYVTGDMVIAPGVLPTDGVNSRHRATTGGPITTGPNSPRNWAGVTGSVDASPPPPAPANFRRGDIDQDGVVTIGDAIGMLDILFEGLATTCELAADGDDDGELTIGDPIGLLAYLFSSGAAPLPPSDACGDDPTPGGTLWCDSHGACP
jgi:hypothetical protein